MAAYRSKEAQRVRHAQCFDNSFVLLMMAFLLYMMPLHRLLLQEESRMKALSRVGLVVALAATVVLATPKHAFAQG